MTTGEESPPRVSVVMPAYNTAGTIQGAIASVLHQTEPSFELLVVDDGSADDTVDRVGEFDDPRIRLLRRDHGGAAAARNAGVTAARAPIIAFLDSDDLILPRFLEVMAGALDAHPDAGFAHTDAYMLEVESGRVRRDVAMARYKPRPLPRSAEELHLSLLRQNYVYNAAAVPRPVLQRLGGFDESLGAGIDYEMWLRIAAHGYTATQGEGVLAVYRWGRPDSISASRERVLTNLVRLYGIAAEQHPGTPASRALARKRRAAFAAELTAACGGRTPRALAFWGRDMAIRIRENVRTSSKWYAASDLPTELIRAFPELFARDA
jgi:glycosyltransferase involved in cell wall biosynthesis